MCVALVDPPRWGMGNRIERCLNALRTYGGAARSEIPALRALQAELVERKWNPERLQKIDIPGLIRDIQNQEETRELRRLEDLQTKLSSVEGSPGFAR